MRLMHTQIASIKSAEGDRYVLAATQRMTVDYVLESRTGIFTDDLDTAECRDVMKIVKEDRRHEPPDTPDPYQLNPQNTQMHGQNKQVMPSCATSNFEAHLSDCLLCISTGRAAEAMCPLTGPLSLRCDVHLQVKGERALSDTELHVHTALPQAAILQAQLGLQTASFQVNTQNGIGLAPERGFFH